MVREQNGRSCRMVRGAEWNQVQNGCRSRMVGGAEWWEEQNGSRIFITMLKS